MQFLFAVRQRAPHASPWPVRTLLSVPLPSGCEPAPVGGDTEPVDFEYEPQSSLEERGYAKAEDGAYIVNRLGGLELRTCL